MNLEKFSKRALEVIQNAQNIAIKNSNPQLTENHLAYALFMNSDSLVYRVVNLIGADSSKIREQLKSIVDNMPKQTGADNVYPNATFQRHANIVTKGGHFSPPKWAKLARGWGNGLSYTLLVGG